MREYIPFVAMEQLLLTAIGLRGSSIKSIAPETNDFYPKSLLPMDH